MTDEQRNVIKQLRQQGLGYKRIARALGVSRDTVRGYCRNHGLNNCGSCQREDKKRIQRNTGRFREKKCAYCGKAFMPRVRQQQKYCSRYCYIHDRFYRQEDLVRITGSLKNGEPVADIPEWIRELMNDNDTQYRN